jgi:hypothetical protein
MKTDRLNELEKIADKLGIGQNREVKCVSCQKRILFRNAILLTNKEKISHLCPECNEKLTKGELNRNPDDEIMKQIEAIRKEAEKNIQPPPYIPWKKTDDPYYEPYKIGDVTYQVYTSSNLSEDTTLLKLEPEKYANRTS